MLISVPMCSPVTTYLYRTSRLDMIPRSHYQKISVFCNFGSKCDQGLLQAVGFRNIRFKKCPTSVVSDPVSVKLFATGMNVASSVVLAPNGFTSVHGGCRIIMAQSQTFLFLVLGLIITFIQLDHPTVVILVVVSDTTTEQFVAEARGRNGAVYPRC